MDKPYSYWRDTLQFERQSHLLGDIFRLQQEGYIPGGDTGISFVTLGDKQRQARIGCVYFAGSRIDSGFCLGSRNAGVLHSALPTDYPKAIRPAFHSDHDELMLCTHGNIVVQYATELKSGASVSTRTLEPGEHLVMQRGWAHKISLQPLRDSGTNVAPVQMLEAGFLAVKMGSLSGKGEDEDLTRWSPSRSHPLIDIWRDEERFLAAIVDEPDACARLCIDQADLRKTIGA